MPDFYAETAAINPEAWATMQTPEILAQIREHAARMRDAIGDDDTSPTVVLSRKHLEMLVERASPAARVELAGMFCNTGGVRLVIAETEEQQRKALISLAAERAMTEPLFVMDEAAYWERLRQRKIDGYEPTWDEMAPRPAGLRPAPVNRQQRRAAEREMRKGR